MTNTNTPFFHSKLPDVGTTIFTLMSQLATEYQAVNLGQGFPDFDMDAKLIEHVTNAMKQGYNQYPPMIGIEKLRDNISNKINNLYNYKYSPEKEITVTAGATQALMTAIMTVVNPGDEVIIIEPAYDSYVPAILLCGGIPVPVQMDTPTINNLTYSIDWDKVKRAITKKTKLLILNSPHNPTGYTFNEKDLNEIERIVFYNNIYILSDEVYEHITFNGPHLSLASRPSIVNRTFIVSSFGKTFHVTGWKVGYCCAPKHLMTEFRKIHQFMVFTVNTPAQVGIAYYLENPDNYLHLSTFYKKKKDILLQAIEKSKFIPMKSDGTYFMLANYSDISSESELEFSKQLTINHGITVIPMSAFYLKPNDPGSNNHLVRFCFAKKESTLALAASRILSI